MPLTFSFDNANSAYKMDSATFTTDGQYYGGGTATTCASDSEQACAWPQVQALLILVNENADCTSSMVCKDGMKALINVKGKLSGCGGSGCKVTTADITANWATTDTSGATVFVDQTVSSGYTTVAGTVERVTRLDESDNVCEVTWEIVNNSNWESACVQYKVKMLRPFTAADPTTDMTIYADPNNSGGYATSYVFRGVFGPLDKATEKMYQCSDQTINFSAFYNDSADAVSGLAAFGSLAMGSIALSILF